MFLNSCKQSDDDLFDKAYSLTKEKKFDDAIKVYDELIHRNNKLQLAFYNRGFCYLNTQKYFNALADFNKVMDMQTFGDYTLSYNKDMPYATEEMKASVPYNDALYQRAQVKFLMDSLRSSFIDFQTLVNNNYSEKSNCILWQGTIYVKSGKTDKACDYFNNAKQVAITNDDKNDADKMIKTYCKQTK